LTAAKCWFSCPTIRSCPVDVLYALSQPQAEAQGVTDVQFDEAMSGDALLHTT
jgi:hypothetical protein